MNLQYPNEVSKTSFHVNVLATCIMDKFQLPIKDNMENLGWLLDQLGDFAVSMHEIGGKFAIDEMQKRYNVSPK